MTRKGMADKRKEILRLNALGLNPKTIAYQLNYSVRAIQRILERGSK